MIGVIGTWEDVTERLKIEQQLAATNNRLSALLNALPVGVCFSEDQTCELITGNLAALWQFGVRPNENISASARDITVPGRQIQFFQGTRKLKNSVGFVAATTVFQQSHTGMTSSDSIDFHQQEKEWSCHRSRIPASSSCHHQGSCHTTTRQSER
jgi:hypothetical protein